LVRQTLPAQIKGSGYLKGAFMAVRSSTLFQLLSRGQLSKLAKVLDENNVNSVNPGGYSLLHEAVSKQNTEAVRLLLDNKAQVDSLDPEGSSPLVYAASHLNTEIAKLLLDAGANPNVKDNDGMTALRWAITRPFKDPSILYRLLEYGADPWIENNAGVSTVGYAETVHPELADELKRAKPKN
jgi:ankyrin repeat protein